VTELVMATIRSTFSPSSLRAASSTPFTFGIAHVKDVLLALLEPSSRLDGVRQAAEGKDQDARERVIRRTVTPVPGRERRAEMLVSAGRASGVRRHSKK
jgi:hypothetical protein